MRLKSDDKFCSVSPLWATCELNIGEITEYSATYFSLNKNYCYRPRGSVLVYRFTRAATKDQTIHNSYPMTPEQRKNNGYSLVNPYTRPEPTSSCKGHM